MRPKVSDYSFSISDRRGVAAGAELHVLGFGFGAEFGFPDLFPVEIKCQRGIDAFIGCGEEDAVFPHYWTGSSFPGEGNFPGELVGAPFGRVVFTGPAPIV